MKFMKWLLVAGLAIIVVLFFALLQDKPKFSITTDRAAVIKEIQSLQRLETAQFTLEKIIDAKTNVPEWQEFLFGDKLLLIAHARVIAGVDMAKLSESSVIIEPEKKKITLTLPPTELFLVDLDESKTQVYDRQKGLLTKGEDQLETKARQAAEETMADAACDSGILTTASDNAKQQLEKLLGVLGFEEITVQATAGNCCGVECKY